MPQIGKTAGQIVQAHGQIRFKGLGIGLGQTAADFHRLLRSLQGFLAMPQIGKTAGQIVQAHGQIRFKGLGGGLGQPTVHLHRLLHSLQGLLPTPQSAQSSAQIVQPQGLFFVVFGQGCAHPVVRSHDLPQGYGAFGMGQNHPP